MQTGTSQLKQYRGEQVDVTYDAARCIHVAECVRGLPAVFDRSRRPWVLPDNAEADQVVEVVLRCPSGALHFQRHDGGADELPSAENIVHLKESGPLYVRGDLELHLAEDVVLDETRTALCRCGGSQNKPFCDNSHIARGFEADGVLGENKLRVVESLDTGGKLRITPNLNGPLQVEGQLRLASADGQTIYDGNRTFLCRCGGSQNKPFCDGTHRRNGFQAPGV